jgi:Na+/H+ antiporter NhaA
LGGIVIIALFYAGDFSLPYLVSALEIFAGLLISNRLGVRRLPFFALFPALSCGIVN